MMGWIAGVTALFSLVAALLAGLAYLTLYQWRTAKGALRGDELAQLLRSESDRIRQFGDDQARGLREELGARIDGGIRAVSANTVGIGDKLDQEIARMGQEANQNRETLRHTIETKLDLSTDKQSSAAKEFREEMTASFQSLGTRVADALTQAGLVQKERLDGVSTAIAALTDKQEKLSEALRLSVEMRLDAIRSESAAKLEEMRKTVDEKLQSTLETRLNESFKRVDEQLERVHNVVGEIRTFAADVGDLKKLMSNVKVRGTFGELLLGSLLEQFLGAEQFVKDACVKDGSQERVEYAIRLPGQDLEGELLLPVDSKFPKEDYERLVAASERGDVESVAEAGRALENLVKSFAKDIRDKYINPPRTTSFAILFLPLESLYAEALRRPGLFEHVQREYQVTLTGPTTLTALLNALQMGFRTLAIEKRSSEVWQILGAVRTEFGKHNNIVKSLERQLNSALNSVAALGTRTRAMNRKLIGVESLPDVNAQALLGDLGKYEDAEESRDSDI